MDAVTEFKQPLFKFIENNSVSHINLGQIQRNILKSKFMISKHVEKVSVLTTTHIHKDIAIRTIQVMIFQEYRDEYSDTKLKPIIMDFIPVNDEMKDVDDTIQYFIIKDTQAFFNTDKSKFTFGLSNYGSIFTIARFTEKYRSLEDIIINRFAVIIKHQNQEFVKFAANFISILPSFTNGLAEEGRQDILESKSFNLFVKKYNNIVSHMIGSNQMKYNNEYELTSTDLGFLMKKMIRPNPPLEKVFPLIRFKHGGNLVQYSTEPKISPLKFPKEIPSADWDYFLGGTILTGLLPLSANENEDDYKIITPHESFRGKEMFINPPESIPRKKDIKKSKCPNNDYMEIGAYVGDTSLTKKSFRNWYEEEDETGIDELPEAEHINLCENDKAFLKDEIENFVSEDFDMRIKIDWAQEVENFEKEIEKNDFLKSLNK